MAAQDLQDYPSSDFQPKTVGVLAVLGSPVQIGELPGISQASGVNERRPPLPASVAPWARWKRLEILKDGNRE